jgi:quercetin dioxygenase-like cupin family protein
LAIETGDLLELECDGASVRVSGWWDSEHGLAGDATHFALVADGEATIEDEHGAISLTTGMYAVLPGQGMIRGVRSRGIVISCSGYQGLRQFGGPAGGEGRLRYIDGCSDTLLVCPPRRGEPCLNHLHVPPRTRQSAHTHPSERIGVILRGRGECHTPSGVYPLTPGLAWRIPPGCLHAFATEEESLDLLAWHPDSDFGPTDTDHPMLNRTFRS